MQTYLVNNLDKANSYSTELTAASNYTILDSLGLTLKSEFTALKAYLASRGLDIKDGDILPEENITPSALLGVEALGRTNYGRGFSDVLDTDNIIMGYIWNPVNGLKLQTDYSNPNQDGIYYQYFSGDIKAPGDIKNKKKSLVTAFPEITRIITNQSTVKSGIIYEGKYLSLYLLYKPEEGEVAEHRKHIPGIYRAYLGFKFDLKSKDMRAMYNDIGCKNDRSKAWVGTQILKTVWSGAPVPSFFTSGGVDDSVSLKGGTYKLSSGRYIEIPQRKFYAADLALFQEFLSTGNKAMKDDAFDLPPNRIFFINKKTQTLTGTDDKGNLICVVLKGPKPISNIDRKMWLTKPSNTLTSKSGSGLNADMTWTMTSIGRAIHIKLRENMDWDTSATLLENVIDSNGYDEFILQPLHKLGQERYGATKVINWLTFMGGVSLLKSCVGKVQEINESVATQRKLFEETGSEGLPSLPNLNSDMVVFPHQAASVAKMNVANDLAILDVGTGGGKTCILLMDILNQMQTGRISRPLLVLPKNLVPQWVSEIDIFTDRSMNIIVVDTMMTRRLKLEALADLCSKAPSNTIFITTYSYIVLNNSPLGKDFEGNDMFDFETAQWIIDNVQPDYLALDESHYIKSTRSKANLAINFMSDTISVKRIATGTLITNKPTDLIGQLQFLDPVIVGNENEFNERYAIEGNPKRGWKNNFAEDLRNHLADYTSYIMYREKDWAPLLPDRKYSYHLVDMTDNQINVYKKLVHNMIAEIEEDPKLAAAWARMQEADADFEGLSPALLGKLAQLEQYLTAPDSKGLLEFSDNEEDAISCKIQKIDELIELSLNSSEVNNKVIVALHYKESARHLFEKSKHRNKAVYYDASKKANITAFKTDPNIKVMFAVQQSISEGHNLQMANRIIVADVDWTPGKLKQLEARIFRPHVKIKDGEIENLNKGKVVFIDTVLANDSADCIKFSFQMHKKILNARIMEKCPLKENEKVGFSSEILTAQFDDEPIFGKMLMDLNGQYNTWMDNVIAEERAKGELKLVKPTIIPGGGNIGQGKMEDLPWIPGMNLELYDGEETLMSYLEENGYKPGEPFTKYKELMDNQYVRCEKGVGFITGVSAKKVRIKTREGSTSVQPSVVIRIYDKAKVAEIAAEDEKLRRKGKANSKSTLSREQTKAYKDKIRDMFLEKGLRLVRSKDRKTGEIYFVVKGRETEIEKPITIRFKDSETGNPVVKMQQIMPAQWEQVLKDALKTVVQHDEDELFALEIHPGSYNDIPCLVAYPDEEAEEDILYDYGFTDIGPHWSFKVPNSRVGLEVLDRLDAKFDIPPKIYDECAEFINDLKRSKYPYYYPEEGVRNFIRDNKKASARGALRIFPLVVNSSLYLVVDIKTNSKVNLSKYRFTKEEGYYIYLSKNIRDLKTIWKTLNNDFDVVNKEKAIKIAQKEFEITLR